ncbi:MAG: hypothetical protein SEPTF4163_005817 [Sporothrix epigloea]
MCRGVVVVYGCRHKEVSQVYMCKTAFTSQQNSAGWASILYCFTGTEPRRKCGQTETERQFVDEPCLSCSRALTRSQSLPNSSQLGPSASVHLHSSLSGGVAPRAYMPMPMPEPMMLVGPSPSPFTAPRIQGKVKAAHLEPARPQKALLATVPSSSRAVPTPTAAPLPPSGRRSSPPVRPPRSPLSASTSLYPLVAPRPVRPPRPHPSMSPLPLPGQVAHGRSNSLPHIASNSGASQLPRTRPAVASSSSQSLPRYASSTSQSQLRSSYTSTPYRPSPLTQRPATIGIAPGRAGDSRPQKADKSLGKGSAAKAKFTPSTRVAPRHGIVTRISTALRTPKSTDSFACADAHRIERGGQ